MEQELKVKVIAAVDLDGELILECPCGWWTFADADVFQVTLGDLLKLAAHVCRPSS